jgi:hypothetical protein
MGYENLGNKDTKAQVDTRLENLRRSFSDSIKNLARSGPGIAYIVGEVPRYKDGDFEKSWEMRENDFNRVNNLIFIFKLLIYTYGNHNHS